MRLCINLEAHPCKSNKQSMVAKQQRWPPVGNPERPADEHASCSSCQRCHPQLQHSALSAAACDSYTQHARQEECAADAALKRLAAGPNCPKGLPLLCQLAGTTCFLLIRGPRGWQQLPFRHNMLMIPHTKAPAAGAASCGACLPGRWPQPPRPASLACELVTQSGKAGTRPRRARLHTAPSAEAAPFRLASAPAVAPCLLQYHLSAMQMPCPGCCAGKLTRDLHRRETAVTSFLLL